MRVSSPLRLGKEKDEGEGLDNRLGADPQRPPFPNQGEASLRMSHDRIPGHSTAGPSTAELNSSSCFGQLNDTRCANDRRIAIVDTAGRAYRSSVGSRHRNSSSDCEHRQLNDRRRYFRYSSHGGERTWPGSTTGFCLLCDCDGVVCDLLCDCRQPRVPDRRTLRLCGSRVRSLRRVSRRDALFLNRTRSGCRRRQRFRQLCCARCSLPRWSDHAHYGHAWCLRRAST